MANVGKLFEKDFQDSFNKYEEESRYSLDRFHDGVGGYAVKNICDYMLYKWPNQYYFELKSYGTHLINFSAISPTQYDGLLEKSTITGVRAGVLFNYNDYNESYFIKIDRIRVMKDRGFKSIPVETARIYGALLPIKRQRKVTVDYDIEKFIWNVSKLYE